MYILGLSAFGHDSSVALLDGTRIVSFVEEERFNRQKHTGAFPELALHHVLSEHGLDLSDIEEVVFFIKPWQFLFFRTARMLQFLPRSLVQIPTHRPSVARDILSLNHHLRHDGLKSRRPPRFRLRYMDHHLSHAASAFYMSEFEDAAILSLDGMGEDITTWFGRGQGTRIERRHAVRLPHSLGLFYSAVTAYLGFKPWGGEGKVMGLAPYGDPDRYYAQMRSVIDWTENGRFKLDLDYFDYQVTGGARWVTPAFEKLFGAAREPESELTQHYQDIAAALQRVVEEAALALVRHLHKLVPSRNLCMAGGVALNSVLNGRVYREGPFENIFVQPAANDAGTALGAALHVAHVRHKLPRTVQPDVVYLGPEYSIDQCAEAAAGLAVERPDSIVERAAELLAGGKIIGWFQGRMEVGPRSLGNRSILADPRDPTMKDTLNHRVKHREGFRPFAPSVIEEAAPRYFDGVERSPHMLLVFPVRSEHRSQLPAITHVDGTARVQTVSRSANQRYHDLLEAFGRRSGVPVLLNTSFNVRGEPMVCTPQDAVRCFLGTEMDYLALGDLLISKP